ncbi:antibiotic biosynthesis monooxygenase family protein [Neorhizobium sp. NPDC001467]|uniref:antibiotic biosynthesis monooxygenase family protein n=1 Tax=Neorhizobium sp. NPDC001467 TaxID=3390595 RepID=UPI003CFCCF1C
MIARTWKATLDLARVDEYEEFARSVSLPMFRQQPGYVGVVMSRSGSTCLVTSFWRSMDDVEMLERSASYQEVVRGILSAGFLTDTKAAEVAEVHLADWKDVGPGGTLPSS